MLCVPYSYCVIIGKLSQYYCLIYLTSEQLSLLNAHQKETPLSATSGNKILPTPCLLCQLITLDHLSVINYRIPTKKDFFFLIHIARNLLFHYNRGFIYVSESPFCLRRCQPLGKEGLRMEVFGYFQLWTSRWRPIQVLEHLKCVYGVNYCYEGVAKVFCICPHIRYQRIKS